MNAPTPPVELDPDLMPLPVPGPVHGPNHLERRHAFARAVAKKAAGESALVLLYSGEEISRNRDNTYPFRFSSDFFYLTGFPEPDAWLVMQVAPDGSHQDTLFCRPRDVEREIWDGVRVGPDAAPERYSFDAAQSLTEIDQHIPKWMQGSRAVVAAWGASASLDQQVRTWLERSRASARGGIRAPDRLIDLSELLSYQRLFKDDQELATMAKAAEISARAHVLAMQGTRAGMAEYEIEAILLAEFRKSGSQSVAYGSIVASGPHSCILHHRAGARIMRDGELLLIDAGCELDGYASDITRTYPVNGRFTGAQRAAYEVVLKAQQAAQAATQVGAAFTAPHEAAVRVIAEGLLDLGLLPKAPVEEVIANGSFRRFYMHRTGHYLGMDVHDVGDYTLPLAERMVLTLEPGLYVQPAADIPEAFWNVGIRIEDDAVVQAQGSRLLTRGVPVEPDAIEAIMRTGH
jgi:Xaa-Pro aminopeptidase